jgi:hypothetical protein
MTSTRKASSLSTNCGTARRAAAALTADHCASGRQTAHVAPISAFFAKPLAVCGSI